MAGRVCSKHPGTGGSLNVLCAPVQPHQSWLVLENRWRAFWGFLVPISGEGEVWWGVGQGKDFSQPPAWAQDFCQKHIHTHLHPYLICKPLSGLVQPGRYRDSLRPPLGPSRDPQTEPPSQMWKTKVSNNQLLLSCLGSSPVTAAPGEDCDRPELGSTPRS